MPYHHDICPVVLVHEKWENFFEINSMFTLPKQESIKDKNTIKVKQVGEDDFIYYRTFFAILLIAWLEVRD